MVRRDEKIKAGLALYDFSFDVLPEEEERRLFLLLREKRENFLKEVKGCFYVKEELARATKESKESSKKKRGDDYILARKVFQEVEKKCFCEIGKRLESEGKTVFCKKSLKRAGNLLKEISEITQKLFNHNARFIIYFYRNFFKFKHEVPFEEILQQSSLGLLTAILKYEPEKSRGRFITYAWYWLVAEVSLYLFNYHRTVPIFYFLWREMLKVRKQLKMEGVLIGSLNREEICELLKEIGKNRYGMREEEIENFANLVYTCTAPSQVSLEVIKERKLDEDDSDYAIDSFLYSHSSFYREEMWEKEPERLIARKESIWNIKKEMSMLSAKEEYILRMRTGFEGDGKKVSLEELGKKLGCSSETIRQTEKKAIKKILY